MDYNSEKIRGTMFNKENVHKVCDIDGEPIYARNFLLIPLRKNIRSSEDNFGELYTAVMMNPSEATEEVSDQTVQLIINRAYDKGFSYVLIVNAIPFFLKYSEKLEEELSKIPENTYVEEMNNNVEMIRNFLSENNLTYVLVATGVPKDKNAVLVREAMINTYKILAEFDNNSNIEFWRHPLTNEGFCPHPQGKAKESLEKFNVSGLDILNK